MNSQFKAACNCDWLTWCGQGLLYDGDLCVCRSVEDRVERNKHPKSELCV